MHKTIAFENVVKNLSTKITSNYVKKLNFFPSTTIVDNNGKERKTRVAVAMSGGVDSSVSAYLLKERGYDVSGIFMQNWDELEEQGFCSGEQDWLDVQQVCEFLKIPSKRVSFVQEYWNFVFQPYIDLVDSGLTPNPDVGCNRYIKFKSFLNHAVSIEKADYIATGHYAKLYHNNTDETSEKEINLMTSVDIGKDQTYFLAQVQKEAFSKVIFPLADLEKLEVRKIASESNISVAKKKDSTGLCFIGNRKYSQFIKQYTKSTPGSFISVDPLPRFKKKPKIKYSNPRCIGLHTGFEQYTIGQAAKVAGRPHKFYITHIDPKTANIYVCDRLDHPKLFSRQCLVSQINWITLPDLESKIYCRTRHRKDLEECTIKFFDNNTQLEVKFLKPSIAIAPGQVIVFYTFDDQNNQICHGGGCIS